MTLVDGDADADGIDDELVRGGDSLVVLDVLIAIAALMMVA